MTDSQFLNDAFVQALGATENQPATALDAFGALVAAVSGVKLVTLMTSDPDTGVAQRIYSNMPDDYPVSGSKPMNRTHWSEVVLEQHQTFIANDIASIAAVFEDHAQIAALGCASVINIPIVILGRVMGTINCLDVEGYFTPARVSSMASLRLSGVAAFMFYNLITKGEV